MTLPPNQPSKDLPSVVIVIPIYKKEFDQEEQVLVDRMFSVFANRELVFVGPQNLEKTYYSSRYPSANFSNFEDHFFESVQGYSRLLLSLHFYETFSDREFLLISQPDVYVFRDDLDVWLQKPYDYVGAPWPKGFSVNLRIGRFTTAAEGIPLNAFVGNGGFSLRRIKTIIRMLENDRQISEWFSETGSNEDLFFSFVGAMTANFILPNPVEASLFAMEVLPDFFFQINGGRLPIAAHAFRKYSPEFWEKFLRLNQVQ